MTAFLFIVFMAISPKPHCHSPSPTPTTNPSRPAETEWPTPSPTVTPTPAVSFPSSNPVLTQEAENQWTTSILVDSFPTCLRDLNYELVTASPNEIVNGQVEKISSLGADEGLRIKSTQCLQPTAEGNEVTLSFRVAFKTVPQEATLVLRQRDGVAVLPSITLTLHRQVTWRQYILIPLVCGLLMCMAFGAAVCIHQPTESQHDGDNTGFWRRIVSHQFWKEPLFASAAWTFKDSWASDITVAVSAAAAILTGAGAVSTLFPGVQLDRFAVLLAICAAIAAIAPLVFSICNARQGERIMLAHGALIIASIVWIRTRGGASVLPARAERLGAEAAGSIRSYVIPPRESGVSDGQDGKETSGKSDGKEVSDQPRKGADIKITKSDNGPEDGRVVALPGDSRIVIAAGSAIFIRDDAISIPPDAEPATGNVPRLRPMEEGTNGATVTVIGVADITLPRGTQIQTPTSVVGITLKSKAIVRVPLPDNTMIGKLGCVVVAGLFTMFAAGAQLGLLGVLAALSIENLGVRILTPVLLGLAAVIVLIYAVVTTAGLANERQGSALSASAAFAL